MEGKREGVLEASEGQNYMCTIQCNIRRMLISPLNTLLLVRYVYHNHDQKS